MRPLVIAVGVAAAVLGSDAGAQERPDFSGEWTVATESRRGPGEFGSGWGPTIEIAQDADTLTVLWPFYSPGDLQPPLRYRYALDGSAVTTTIQMGRGMQELVSRASWDGNALVITTVHGFDHPADAHRATTTVTRILSLESPTSLVVETRIDGEPGGRPTVSRSVYTRG